MVRGAWRRPLAVLAVVVASLGLGACSGDDKEGSGGQGGPGSFALIAAEVAPTKGPPTPFPEPVKDQVMATLNAYLSKGMLEPLRTGSAPIGVNDLFTPAAAARLAGPDAPALTEGPGGKTGVSQQQANVRLTALTAPNGAPETVTAQIDVVLNLESDPRRVVVRTGELVLVPVPGGWRIDGYELQSQRGRPTGDQQ